MRSTSILVAASLLAVAATTTALASQPAIPTMTPSLRLERRVAVGNRHLHQRAPILGFNGGEDDSSNTATDTAANGGQNGSGGSGSTSTSSTSTSATSTTSSTSTSTTSSPTRTTSSTSSTTTPTSTAQSTTNSAGSVVMITSTLPATSTTAAPVAEQTSAAPTDDDSGGGHLGLIIGVSVVGGIAVLGALIFLYMKFGGKRFSDYEQDDSDIKWPELKSDENAAAMQPLPARRTGGAGFDMGEDSDNGHEGLMMGAGAAGGDTHSMHDYGTKAHDSMIASSTALHTPSANGAYGNAGYGGQMDTVYDDENMNNNYDSAGVTGYYDPYNTNGIAGGYGANHTQQQMFYPEQVSGGGGQGGHEYESGGGYGSYGQHDSYGTHTSPPSDPYRMTGRNNGF